jgi:hypothetical protein
MFKAALVALLIVGCAVTEPTFLIGEEADVSSTLVGNGDSELTGVKNIVEENSCLEELVRIDDLVEQLSELFVSETQTAESVVHILGGFYTIYDECVTAFSSPDLMDCSNDIEGIMDKLSAIIDILNDGGEFAGLDADSLARAKETCILPVAEEVCALELEANLEDTADLLAVVYADTEATATEIFEAADDADRELKTLVYACDLAENQTFEAIREAVVRVLLVIQECQDEFKETQVVCDTIDGEELEELVTVLEKYELLPEHEEREEEEELVAEPDSVLVSQE